MKIEETHDVKEEPAMIDMSLEDFLNIYGGVDSIPHIKKWRSIMSDYGLPCALSDYYKYFEVTR